MLAPKLFGNAGELRLRCADGDAPPQTTVRNEPAPVAMRLVARIDVQWAPELHALIHRQLEACRKDADDRYWRSLDYRDASNDVACAAEPRLPQLVRQQDDA